MDAATRRQILGDLGIVPWQLRAVPGDGTPARRDTGTSGVPGPVPPAADARVVDATQGPAGAVARTSTEPEPAAGPPAAGASGTERSPGSAADGTVSATPAVEPFSVLSMVSGDVLVLVDGSASRRDLRLAMDVLGAASGDLAGKPLRRRFEWPPAEDGIGIHADARAARRALAAFVDKDLADHAVRTVLCTPDVAARLPAEPSGAARIELPALASLGQDPAAKRDLWQRLRSGP